MHSFFQIIKAARKFILAAQKKHNKIESMLSYRALGLSTFLLWHNKTGGFEPLKLYYALCD